MNFNEENEKLLEKYKKNIQKNILSKLKEVYSSDPEMLARIKETSKEFLGKEIKANDSSIKTITIVPEGASLFHAYTTEAARICHELDLKVLLNPPLNHPSLYEDKSFVIIHQNDLNNKKDYDLSRIKSGLINLENKNNQLENDVLHSIPSHLVANLTVYKNHNIPFNTEKYQTVELKRNSELRDFREQKPRGIYTDKETVHELNTFEPKLDSKGKLIGIKENPERDNKWTRYMLENYDIVEKVYDEKAAKEYWHTTFDAKMHQAGVKYETINFMTPKRDDLKDKLQSYLDNGAQVIYMNFDMPFTKENAEAIKESVSIAKQLDARVVVSIKSPKKAEFDMPIKTTECTGKTELLEELDNSINDGLLFNIKNNVVSAIKKMKSDPKSENHSQHKMP